MKLLKPIFFTLLIILLTVLTQVGGLILLISVPAFRKVEHFLDFGLKRSAAKISVFIGVYIILSITIVPLIAKSFGRTPLPVFSNAHIKPLNLMTCLLNRHYVRPELLGTVKRVGEKMDKEYPGTILAYLDANFPFFDNFPLIPHLSHDDGKKLDFALFYLDAKSLKPLNRKAPSFIGYGVFEGPRPNEQNKPSDCAKKGNWQYSIMQHIIPQWNKPHFKFDPIRSQRMVQLFVKEPSIGKIFIEPHLRTRLKLRSNKVRYHGCRSVRHDDHIHIQLK